jgi:hypothetical protein
MLWIPLAAVDTILFLASLFLIPVVPTIETACPFFTAFAVFPFKEVVGLLISSEVLITAGADRVVVNVHLGRIDIVPLYRLGG